MAPPSASLQSPSAVPESLRPGRILPTTQPGSLYEELADMLPGCKGRPLRAKARRLAHAAEIIATRIAMRRDPGALGRYEAEIAAALSEPLDSPRPLADLLVRAVAEGNESETALAEVLRQEHPEALRRFIREGEEALGALSQAVSQAKAALERCAT